MLLEVNVGVIAVSTNRVVKQDCLLCLQGQMRLPSQNELTPGKRPAGRNFTAHIDLTVHSSHDVVSIGIINREMETEKYRYIVEYHTVLRKGRHLHFVAKWM